jgi:hypothetical protein
LVLTSKLYFRRCDKFEDKWDAQYSLLPQLLKAPATDELERIRNIRRFLSQQEFMRASTFANCWHRNNDENAAMWEIYTARSSGIAVRSTVGRLKESFKNCARRIWISEVVYGDFEEPNLADHANALPPFFVKRAEYVFENEVRALISSRATLMATATADEPDITELDVGYSCPIDVHRLVESVVIAPAISSHTVPIVKSVLDKFGMAAIPCSHSRLAESPKSVLDFDQHEPRLFRLNLKMEGEMIKMLQQAAEDYHQRHCRESDQLIHSVELLNAVNLAAQEAGYPQRVPIPKSSPTS